jgi:MFS family permease
MFFTSPSNTRTLIIRHPCLGKSQPMYGKLSDIFGRKNVLLAAVFIFLLGSVLCGVSTNMIMIIVMRALQGVGGAGIFSIVFIAVSA